MEKLRWSANSILAICRHEILFCSCLFMLTALPHEATNIWETVTQNFSFRQTFKAIIWCFSIILDICRWSTLVTCLLHYTSEGDGHICNYCVVMQCLGKLVGGMFVIADLGTKRISPAQYYLATDFFRAFLSDMKINLFSKFEDLLLSVIVMEAFQNIINWILRVGTTTKRFSICTVPNKEQAIVLQFRTIPLMLRD